MTVTDISTRKHCLKFTSESNASDYSGIIKLSLDRSIVTLLMHIDELDGHLFESYVETWMRIESNHPHAALFVRHMDSALRALQLMDLDK